MHINREGREKPVEGFEKNNPTAADADQRLIAYEYI